MHVYYIYVYTSSISFQQCNGIDEEEDVTKKIENVFTHICIYMYT